MLKKMYDWVLHWAETPYGSWALFILAFCESSFFPIPPDVLLIALAVGLPSKAFRFALICSAGSLLGGCFGYLIGWQFMSSIGMKIIDLYGLHGHFEMIREKFNIYNAWIVFTAGFTPIPYKLITISAGAFKVNFLVFFIASAVSRSARFFLVSALIYKFGPQIRTFIDKHFNRLAVAFTVLLICGFVVFKYLI
ncbi:MAG: DedA family protein [Proteobacteria bacterium]|nr:DedA family protein [Pseudomonadota bacterium]